ncbi:DUF1361 domain-containing protein [Microcoleus sp. FACHB-68]|uniref:DUF1361 domain-containing protein n=1 Tax=Microcoleus sp. FACHB-68 TaxID=2692826 RepID=UPI0016824FD4|nr:DUF1361 domain-containing protein [Microcoleus sp. FACHB-68]MBD1939375.1 DUF1361 domain-containing protein [Microcoleus sp. FACHB-68]
MTAQLTNWISVAWQALLANNRWMGWNLFLALVPLALSFWLFHRPRSRVLRWGTLILTGITFFLGIRRYSLTSAVNLLRDIRSIYLGIDPIYLVGALIGTLILMGLDFWLLGWRGARSLLWWVGFLAFIFFLPNAPYVLTDVIHFYEEIRYNYSVWVLTLALIPQYLIFMGIGFEAYVLSLIYLGFYLRRQGWGKFILWAELILHALSAIGIYLGRFQRFNSWHVISQPDQLVMSVMTDLTRTRPLLVTVVTFVVIAVFYWLVKQVSLGIMQRLSNPNNAFPPAADPDSSPARF